MELTYRHGELALYMVFTHEMFTVTVIDVCGGTTGICSQATSNTRNTWTIYIDPAAAKDRTFISVLI